MAKIVIPVEVEVIGDIDLSKLEIKIRIKENNSDLIKIRNYLKSILFLTEIIKPRYYGFKNKKSPKRYIVLLEEIKDQIRLSIDKEYCQINGLINSRFGYMYSFLLDSKDVISFLENNLSF